MILHAACWGGSPGTLADSVRTYQPYWAVRAHLLQRLQRCQDAAAAFDQAIALSGDDAVRNFLLERRGR